MILIARVQNIRGGFGRLCDVSHSNSAERICKRAFYHILRMIKRDFEVFDDLTSMKSREDTSIIQNNV